MVAKSEFANSCGDKFIRRVADIFCKDLADSVEFYLLTNQKELDHEKGKKDAKERRQETNEKR